MDEGEGTLDFSSIFLWLNSTKAHHSQDGTNGRREKTRSYLLLDSHEVVGKFKSREAFYRGGSKAVLRTKSPGKLPIP